MTPDEDAPVARAETEAETLERVDGELANLAEWGRALGEHRERLDDVAGWQEGILQRLGALEGERGADRLAERALWRSLGALEKRVATGGGVHGARSESEGGEPQLTTPTDTTMSAPAAPALPVDARLRGALKKLTLMARTAGGWKPDADLMQACEEAETLLLAYPEAPAAPALPVEGEREAHIREMVRAFGKRVGPRPGMQWTRFYAEADKLVAALLRALPSEGGVGTGHPWAYGYFPPNEPPPAPASVGTAWTEEERTRVFGHLQDVQHWLESEARLAPAGAKGDDAATRLRDRKESVLRAAQRLARLERGVAPSDGLLPVRFSAAEITEIEIACACRWNTDTMGLEEGRALGAALEKLRPLVGTAATVVAPAVGAEVVAWRWRRSDKDGGSWVGPWVLLGSEPKPDPEYRNEVQPLGVIGPVDREEIERAVAEVREEIRPLTEPLGRVKPTGADYATRVSGGPVEERAARVGDEYWSGKTALRHELDDTKRELLQTQELLAAAEMEAADMEATSGEEMSDSDWDEIGDLVQADIDAAHALLTAAGVPEGTLVGRIEALALSRNGHLMTVAGASAVLSELGADPAPSVAERIRLLEAEGERECDHWMDVVAETHTLLTEMGIPTHALEHGIDEIAHSPVARIRLLAQRGPEGERLEGTVRRLNLDEFRADAYSMLAVRRSGGDTSVHIIVPPEGRAEGGDPTGPEAGRSISAAVRTAVAPPASAQAGAGEDVRR